MSNSQLSKPAFTMSGSPSAQNVATRTQSKPLPKISSNVQFRNLAKHRLQSLQRQHDREVYNHKFIMKEEALQVALQ